MKIQNPVKLIAAIISVSLCTGTIAYLQLQELSKSRAYQEKALTDTEVQKQLNQTQANLAFLQRLPSFGFDNLIADWAFLQFLQYFGDEPARTKTGYGLSPKFFEIIVDRNPRFFESYISLSTSVSLYSGKPEQAVALMEKGLQSLSPQTDSKAYHIWRYKAVNELLFLGDSQAAQQSHLKAAEWAEISSDSGSDIVAKISRQTAQFLAKNPTSKRAQISSWASVLSNAPDQPTRELAINRIQKLGGKVSVSPQGEVRVQLPEQD